MKHLLPVGITPWWFCMRYLGVDACCFRSGYLTNWHSNIVLEYFCILMDLPPGCLLRRYLFFPECVAFCSCPPLVDICVCTFLFESFYFACPGTWYCLTEYKGGCKSLSMGISCQWWCCLVLNLFKCLNTTQTFKKYL